MYAHHLGDEAVYIYKLEEKYKITFKYIHTNEQLYSINSGF